MRRIIAVASMALAVRGAWAATAVATYDFNNNFLANEVGAPALTAVDPLGTSDFQTDTVFGQTRTVWAFNGSNSPATDQAGLTVNTTGLVSPENYSVDMVVELTQQPNGWRRLMDVQNRQSDNGFYVNPSDNLSIFPAAGSSAGWTNDVYHHIVLTDDGTTVTVYLDGVSQFSTSTTEMNLDFDPTDNPNKLMGFFLDNVANGATTEWSEGDVALIRLWDGVLTPSEAQALAANPFVPEPASLGLLGTGSLLLGLRRRRPSRG